MNWMRLGLRLGFSFLAMHSMVLAQGPTTIANNAAKTNSLEEEVELSAAAASIFAEKNARIMTLSIPAPRGLIMDREGRPLAQTKMAYHLAIDFTKFDNQNAPDKAVAWAQELLKQSNQLTEGEVTISDKKFKNYFQHRRWIPRKASQIFTDKKAKTFEGKLPEGLVLLPVYMRHYPMKALAAHLIGYVGTRTRLPDGPIIDGDPIFESVEGKAGFEKVFDKELRGIPGEKKVIYDSKGNKVFEEYIRRPRPGGNIVTTLDLDWQQHAERVLRGGTKRGAFVVIDVLTGEVLCMASRPSFDLNDFIPYISTERYAELRDDENAPLYGRAFQNSYPPASTFKPVVALAAITNGVVKPWTKIDCPYKIKIGSKWFKNHSKGHQGKVTVHRALAKSINPWFYQVGIKTGPQAFLSVARRLGFGSKTGLPLVGESPGQAPTADVIERKLGRPTTDGDTANLSIGQGEMTATPLQVAQGMAGIANGAALMELRLVNQIQDFHGRVIKAPSPKIRNDLNFSPEAIKATHTGMFDVVHAKHGTGKKASLSFTYMCGKTGTAQWRPNQGLAWFSGFFPHKDPRYAFAVVYEGSKGQTVSGGRNAGPLVRRFFQNFKTEIQDSIKAPPKALIVVDEEDDDGLKPAPSVATAEILEDDEFPDAQPVTEADLNPEKKENQPAEPEQPEQPADDPNEVPEALPIDSE